MRKAEHCNGRPISLCGFHARLSESSHPFIRWRCSGLSNAAAPQHPSTCIHTWHTQACTHYTHMHPYALTCNQSSNYMHGRPYAVTCNQSSNYMHMHPHLVLLADGSNLFEGVKRTQHCSPCRCSHKKWHLCHTQGLNIHETLTTWCTHALQLTA